MPFGDNQLIDLVERLRADLTNVVANAAPIERGLFVPVADAHDMSQSTMLFCQIVELVIVEPAPEADRRQHEDLPVVHPLSPAVVTRLSVHVLGDEPKDFIPQVGPGVDVLQCLKDWDNLVTTLPIEFDIQDGS